jgi:hypothetical protein
MASTLYSAQVASGVQPRDAVGVNVAYGTYELSAALVINDVIQMVKIPKGATVTDVTLATDDLDSNGTPAIVLEVGDDGDTDRFIAASTVAQAGGVTTLGNIAGFGYAYTAENTIDVKVPTAPATGATSGTISIAVTYIMNN